MKRNNSAVPKPLTTPNANDNVGNGIKTNKNYRQIISELPYKTVSGERYNKLIIPLKKLCVTIMCGAEGDTLDENTVLFKQKFSISAILEETHHIRQNRQKLNNDKDVRLRNILNKIDAKNICYK